jgi:ankyrin repeat protein
LRTLWHFISSNLRYNKIELAISYGGTIIFTLLYWYFNDGKKKVQDNSELFISVAFYAILYVFFSNKRKTSVKYLISLPLSKSEILFYKIVGDFVFFVPAIYLLMMGAFYSNYNIHLPILFIGLVLAVFIGGLLMFDQEIEQPRLDNARSSFINRLVYVRKSTEFIFRSMLMIYLVTIVFILPIDLLWKEYIMLIFLGVTLFMKFQKSLLLMKDESLSYFKFKRDSLRVSWKLALLLGPVILMQLQAIGLINPYGDEEIFTDVYYGNVERVENYFDKERNWEVPGNDGFTPLLAAIHLGQVKIARYMIETGAKVKWDHVLTEGKYKGMTPLHLAIDSGSEHMVNYLLSLDKEQINLIVGKEKVSPLLFASTKCNPEVIKVLLNYKPTLNHTDSNGRTALHHQAKRKCYSGMILLVESGVNPDLKDKSQKMAIDYIKSSNFAHYLKWNMKEKVELHKKKKTRYLLKRNIASELIRKQDT